MNDHRCLWTTRADLVLPSNVREHCCDATAKFLPGAASTIILRTFQFSLRVTRLGLFFGSVDMAWKSSKTFFSWLIRDICQSEMEAATARKVLLDGQLVPLAVVYGNITDLGLRGGEEAERQSALRYHQHEPESAVAI